MVCTGRCANDVAFCAVGAACDVGSYAYLPYLHRMKFVPSKKYVRAGAASTRAGDPQGRPRLSASVEALIVVSADCWAKLYILGRTLWISRSTFGAGGP